jgi:hypothetical protein
MLSHKSTRRGSKIYSGCFCLLPYGLDFIARVFPFLYIGVLFGYKDFKGASKHGSISASALTYILQVTRTDATF